MFIKRIVREEVQTIMLEQREAMLNSFRNLSDEVAGDMFLTGDVCHVTGLYRSVSNGAEVEMLIKEGTQFPPGKTKNKKEITAIWELTSLANLTPLDN